MKVNIVEDFQFFLDFLNLNNVKLTKKNEFLTKNRLKSINEQMTEPTPPITKKEQQLDYPMLHLFFHLGLSLDLLRKVQGPGGVYLQVVKDRQAIYESLNGEEKYASLLEAFWTESDWSELIGSNRGQAPHNIDFLFEHLERYQANEKIHLKNDGFLKDLLSRYDHFLYYFHYFGLWEVEIDEEKKEGSYYEAKSISLTPLFDLLEKPLYDAFNPIKNEKSAIAELSMFANLIGIEMNIENQEEKGIEEKRESLFTKLQSVFPEGKLTQSFIDSGIQYVKGSFLFKVALGNHCWRRIQLSSSHTLLDLHNQIQKAFEFNDDHMYAFYMDGKRFSRHRYNSPMDDRGPYVMEAKIGSLKLYEGKSFLYLFDFGDEWHFNVEVKKIVEGEENVHPMIKEYRGEAPEQYGW